MTAPGTTRTLRRGWSLSALLQSSDVDLFGYGEGAALITSSVDLPDAGTSAASKALLRVLYTPVLRLGSLAPRTSSPGFHTADFKPERFCPVDRKSVCMGKNV